MTWRVLEEAIRELFAVTRNYLFVTELGDQGMQTYLENSRVVQNGL